MVAFSSNTVNNPGTLAFILPESMMRQNLMSDTSDAASCFVDQRFSNKLQAFMVNYVIATSSFYSIYG